MELSTHASTANGSLALECRRELGNVGLGIAGGCVKPLSVSRSDDALSAGACSLNNGLSGKIDVGNLERRISEIEPGWRPAANLSHTNLRKTAFPECQRLFHGTDHGDLRSSIGQYDGSGCEGAEDIDDSYRSRRLGGSIQKTSNPDFHKLYSHSTGQMHACSGTVRGSALIKSHLEYWRRLFVFAKLRAGNEFDAGTIFRSWPQTDMPARPDDVR